MRGCLTERNHRRSVVLLHKKNHRLKLFFSSRGKQLFRCAFFNFNAMIFAEVKHDYQRHSLRPSRNWPTGIDWTAQGAGIAASAASRHGRLLSRISLCIRTPRLYPLPAFGRRHASVTSFQCPFGRTNRRFDSRCFSLGFFAHDRLYSPRSRRRKTQNCQDRLHDNFVRRSSLAAIITRHGFNLDRILDESRFPLKENQLPDICADRIDYCLRAGVLSGDLTLEDKDVILDRLVIHNGSFVFDNLNAAIKFSRLFYHLNHNMWSGFASAVQFCVSALMFRRAIDISSQTGRLLQPRWCGNHQTIEASGLQDKELASYYQMLQNPPEYFCDNAEPCLDRIFCKNRTVDPSGYNGIAKTAARFRIRFSLMPPWLPINPNSKNIVSASATIDYLQIRNIS